MNKIKATILITLLPILTLAQKKHSQEEVYNKMVEVGITHPKIVLKQAIHESANLKYKYAQKKNNYLGLMNSKGNLRYFDSLESSLVFYKERIQNRYKGGDYWKFLAKIGYAEDPNYNKKVQNVKLDFIIE